jgi:hypothetical protein
MPERRSNVTQAKDLRLWEHGEFVGMHEFVKLLQLTFKLS